MLRRYTWESQKKRLQHYKRRQPEISPLYQIVYHSLNDLKYVWESKFQHHYGYLRDEVPKTLKEYLNCGILLTVLMRRVVYRCCYSCRASAQR
jgi:hypothetical protein